ncbi:unnamed protein product, partial [Amoebophrya sp. A25]
ATTENPVEDIKKVSSPTTSPAGAALRNSTSALQASDGSLRGSMSSLRSQRPVEIDTSTTPGELYRNRGSTTTRKGKSSS